MQYIEFFFGNFWHWLGLAIIVGIIFSPAKVIITKNKKKY